MPLLSKPKIDFALAVWLTLVMMSGIKTHYSALIPWGATLLLFLFLPSWRVMRERWQELSVAGKKSLLLFLALFGLFAATVFIVGILHNQTLIGLKYFSKYFILSACFTLFVFLRVDGKTLERALTLCLGITCLLLVVTFLTGYGYIIQDDGRIGFYLSAPGTFWKVGGYLYILFAYRFLESGKLVAFILTIACLTVAGLDGSRSALLVVFSGYALMFVWYLFLNRRFPAPKKSLTILFALLLGFWAMPLLANISLNAFNHNNRVNSFDTGTAMTRMVELKQTLAPSNETQVPLYPSDNVRKRMLMAAFQAVRDRPFGSNGIGRTTVPTTTESEVVHMTYLQIWGDCGLLALLFYLVAMVSFAPAARQGITDMQKRTGLNPDAFLLCIMVMTGYLIYGLFNPLSNEPSEWGLYLLALAALVNKASTDRTCSKL